MFLSGLFASFLNEKTFRTGSPLKRRTVADTY